MIAPDWKLKELCEKHELVTPYDEALINPASYNLTLGNEFRLIPKRYGTIRRVLANMLRHKTDGKEFYADNYTLKRGRAVLACTVEYVRIPPIYAGKLFMRSTPARVGVDHALAGWIEPGFHGQVTLELFAHETWELVAGESYVQLVLERMEGKPDKLYGEVGHYQGQTGVTPSVWNI